MSEPHLKDMPEREFFNGNKEAAEKRALEINEAGGFAWTEAEYGNDMGHENVFWGYRVMFFSPGRVAERFGQDTPEEEGRITNRS